MIAAPKIKNDSRNGFETKNALKLNDAILVEDG